MKIVYSKAFAAQLRKNLQAISHSLINVPAKNGEPLPISFVEEMIRTVETETGRRITTKSPNWVFDQLLEQLDTRLNPNRTDVGDIIREVVQKSREEAFQAIHNTSSASPENKGCREANMIGYEFVAMIGTLKEFTIKNGMNISDKRLQLVFSADEKGSGVVDGYACNGISIAHATFSCALTGGPFTVYIDIPRLKPKRTSLVHISLKGETAYVSFDEVEFRTGQTAAPRDLQALRGTVKLDDDNKSVLISPTLLKKMATAICSSGISGGVKMTVGGEFSMVGFQNKGIEILLCPIRPEQS